MNHIATLTKVTLLLITMMTMMSNVAIITAIPHLKEYFSDTANIEFLSRMMITAPSLSIAFLAPILGHIVYKYGKKRSAIIGLVFFGITGSAGLYLDSIETLLISRFLLGIAIAVLMIVSTTLVGDYFKDEARHKFMGLQSAFISIGGIVFVVGGGALSDINWRFPFAIYVIGFLLIPFVFKYLHEYTSESVQDDGQDINANLWGIYFLAFLLMTLFFILPTQMPFLIINHFGMSGAITGSIIASAFVFNALGAMSFVKFKRRFSFPTIYIIGLVIISVGFIGIGFVSNVYFLFITSPIMGFGGGVLMTTVQAWMLSKSHHTKRTKAAGYLTSALFLGQFFSPIVFHPVVHFFGIEHFFMFVGAMIAVGVVLTLGVLRMLKK